ncbi:sugar transporter STL1 [Aaosphaeria arxii CBS 175.79]|uniref:Sugar transporter STL1 n=1 Tax=Aaosphaeria arxii CBS 175.79 TaxID=1450172 RepID=A0A6A5Y7C9_9PLEO|nr:sugar transporter STL1 [Aaosphaeria arxii CBS 175.79]KAF2021196.1 sugar transporter STL1 [Aaosphaeria arxii CBS 175.79]
MQPLTGKQLDWAVISCCSAAFLLFGYDQGVMGGLVSTPEFLKSFNHPTPGLLGIIVAIYDIGCMIGSLCTMYIGDVLGRRKSIVIGGVLIIIGAALQSSAFSVAHMIVGRIVTGLGSGMNTTTVPIFQTEMSQSHRRGAAVMGEMAFVIFGIVVSNWVDFGFVFGGGVQGSAVWRAPLALQAVFPLVTFAILPFIPESPRWLASKGRNDEVREIVARLEGKGYTAESDVVISHSRLIIEAAQHEAEIEASWMDLFRNGELQNLRRMLLGAIPQFIQQMTGINAVVYFGPAIFSASLGLTPRMAAIVGGCGSICFWIGSCTPPFFIEKVGRRPIFLVGLISTALAMTGLTFSATKVSSGYGALACILLYQFCFGASWAGVPWVYAPEINSLRMRNRAAAIASATEWLSAFIVVVITPVGVANIGWRFYLIWLVSCGLALPYMYLTCPETKGATLEEMDRYFATQRSWIVINAKNIKEYNQNYQEDPIQREKQLPSTQEIEVSG